MRSSVLITAAACLASPVFSFNYTLRDIARRNITTSDNTTSLSINATATNPTAIDTDTNFTMDGAMDGAPGGKGYFGGGEVKGIIPVTDVTCTGTEVDLPDWNRMWGLLVAWGRNYTVPPRTMKYIMVNETMIYMCNCKWFHNDPVLVQELHEVENLLRDKCGPWQTGIVFSKTWDKAWEVQPRKPWDEMLDDPIEKFWPAQRACPRYCVQSFLPY